MLKSKFKFFNIGLSLCVCTFGVLGGNNKVNGEVATYVYSANNQDADYNISNSYRTYSCQPSRSYSDYLKKIFEAPQLSEHKAVNGDDFASSKIDFDFSNIINGIKDKKENISAAEDKNTNVIESVQDNQNSKVDTVLAIPKTYSQPVSSYVLTTAAAGSPPDEKIKLQNMDATQAQFVPVDCAWSYVDFINWNLGSVYYCASSVPGPGTGSSDFYKTCDMITLQILIGLGVIMMISFLCVWIYLKRNRIINFLKGVRPVKPRRLALSYE